MGEQTETNSLLQWTAEASVQFSVLLIFFVFFSPFFTCAIVAT